MAADAGSASPSPTSLAYAQSKLANLLFAPELQRCPEAAGSGVRAQAAQPGLVATEIYRESGPVSQFMVRLMAQSPSRALSPSCTRPSPRFPATASPVPAISRTWGGAPELIGRSSAAQDAEIARRLWTVSEQRRLWTVSEQLTGVAWPLQSRQSGSLA